MAANLNGKVPRGAALGAKKSWQVLISKSNRKVNQDESEKCRSGKATSNATKRSERKASISVKKGEVDKCENKVDSMEEIIVEEGNPCELKNASDINVGSKSTKVQITSKRLVHKKRDKIVTRQGPLKKNSNSKTLKDQFMQNSKEFHETITEVNGAYDCNKCEFVTSQILLAKQHVNQCGKKKRNKKSRNMSHCSECEKEFLSKADLKNHFVEAHQKNMYRCTKCEMTFEYKDDFSTHIKKVHSKSDGASKSEKSTTVGLQHWKKSACNNFVDLENTLQSVEDNPFSIDGDELEFEAIMADHSDLVPSRSLAQIDSEVIEKESKVIEKESKNKTTFLQCTSSPRRIESKPPDAIEESNSSSSLALTNDQLNLLKTQLQQHNQHILTQYISETYQDDCETMLCDNERFCEAFSLAPKIESLKKTMKDWDEVKLKEPNDKKLADNFIKLNASMFPDPHLIPKLSIKRKNQSERKAEKGIWTKSEDELFKKAYGKLSNDEKTKNKMEQAKILSPFIAGKSVNQIWNKLRKYDRKVVKSCNNKGLPSNITSNFQTEETEPIHEKLSDKVITTMEYSNGNKNAPNNKGVNDVSEVKKTPIDLSARKNVLRWSTCALDESDESISVLDEPSLNIRTCSNDEIIKSSMEIEHKLEISPIAPQLDFKGTSKNRLISPKIKDQGKPEYNHLASKVELTKSNEKPVNNTIAQQVEFNEKPVYNTFKQGQFNEKPEFSTFTLTEKSSEKPVFSRFTHQVELNEKPAYNTFSHKVESNEKPAYNTFSHQVESIKQAYNTLTRKVESSEKLAYNTFTHQVESNEKPAYNTFSQVKANEKPAYNTFSQKVESSEKLAYNRFTHQVESNEKPVYNTFSYQVEANEKQAYNTFSHQVESSEKLAYNTFIHQVESNKKPAYNIFSHKVESNEKMAYNNFSHQVELNEKPVYNTLSHQVESNEKPVYNTFSHHVKSNKKPAYNTFNHQVVSNQKPGCSTFTKEKQDYNSEGSSLGVKENIPQMGFVEKLKCNVSSPDVVSNFFTQSILSETVNILNGPIKMNPDCAICKHEVVNESITTCCNKIACQFCIEIMAEHTNICSLCNKSITMNLAAVQDSLDINFNDNTTNEHEIRETFQNEATHKLEVKETFQKEATLKHEVKETFQNEVKVNAEETEIEASNANEDVIVDQNGASYSSNSVSSQRKGFSCQKCGAFGFRDLWNLNRHDERMHNMVNVFCKKCEITFVDRLSYIAHDKTCYYTCRFPNCPFFTRREPKLKIHERKHMKE